MDSTAHEGAVEETTDEETTPDPPVENKAQGDGDSGEEEATD